jgi:hypothetical protein
MWEPLLPPRGRNWQMIFPSLDSLCKMVQIRIFGITKLSIMTFSITTFSIMTLSIKGLEMALSI